MTVNHFVGGSNPSSGAMLCTKLYLICIINDVFINNKNQKITANFILNKTPIGSLIFSSPKTQYSFPRTVKFQLPENIILIGNPNILEIDIEGANSEKNLGIGNDLRMLGLALVELSLR